ncbi:TIGR02587 family membrane protein [Rufibacter radiotolerans]|uniref:TIGR02587 family membrane protein n=1 Tax=Rufibacter radiotolerans TaxID=1379910 RepID=UPI0006647D71|nr:TIGR02587 family membrane protein [Rufibacter radiotolerans]
MQDRTIEESLQEYGRGIIGGLLFSLPMLYTMEVWWTSFHIVPWQLVLYIVVTFVLLLAYNTYAGLRPSASWKEVAIDSVEEMGLGLLLSFLILWLLGRIDLGEMPLERVVYKVVVEAMTVAIGVSVGTAQLGASGDEEEEQKEEGNEPLGLQQASTLEAVLLATCAGMLFGANIAPTDEVVMIAASVTPFQLLLLCLASLALSTLVLFYIGFKGAYETPANEKPKLLELLWSVSITYATAFCVSAGALWFFGRFNGAGLEFCIAMTVVLAMVSSLGASAGRFLFDQEYKEHHEKKSA